MKPLAICARCTHYRVRPPPQLFSGADMQSPGVLKSKLEWDQQDNERRLVEMQRFEAGQPFNYEPYHYPWCAALTPVDNALPGLLQEALAKGDMEGARAMARKSVEDGRRLVKAAEAGNMEALMELAEHGRATANPVTGEVQRIYALCARVNPMGQCVLFEPREAKP